MATVWAALGFASENRRAMVHDQIEVFRRGFLDEPQVPVGHEYGEQHEFLAEFPEAYVIPVGEGQRSDVAAVELVNHLLANDVQVERASRPFSAGGRLYGAGSYIVPMQQPKRGLANTILEPGYDITDVVEAMYDISGWSLGELWGATRAAVPDGQPLAATSAPVKNAQRADGSVEAGGSGAYALRVDTPSEVRAVNELLDAGVALQRSDDGRVFAPASARTRLQRLASEDGLDFAAAAVPAGAEALQDVRIAAAASADELFVLRRLGFDVDPVTTGAVNGGAQLDAYDVVYVSASGLRWAQLNPPARAEVRELLARGGIIGRGSQGGRFNSEAGLLAVTTVAGDSDANGIGHVDNAAGSPVTSTAPEQTFVYSPVWFTGAGAGVEVAQRFESGDFFFSGHWIGQERAAGQAVVVHGEAGDGRVALFGSNPLFRAHPRGLFAQVAHAAWWGGSDS
jgi:hypothetical protein